jgi:hypothetical protein
MGGTVNRDDVTVVVVPRDHFSDTRESLESVLACSPLGCPVVYVDGGSPPRIASWLREQSTGAPPLHSPAPEEIASRIATSARRPSGARPEACDARHLQEMAALIQRFL